MTTTSGTHRVPASQPSAARPPAYLASSTARTSPAMTGLRVTTYILTSLASLVFLVLVVYGAVKVAELQNALSTNPLFGGAASSSAPYSYEGSPSICEIDPTSPLCGG